MSHRVDIDGLRGVAIALVVIFHVWVGKVSSGVDVFLLLGGLFLISSQWKRVHGGMSLLQSIGRVVRRLYVPMLIVVVTFGVIGLVVYSTTHWQGIAQDASASLLYFMNWHLGAAGNDYGAASADVSLFQHLWSMSVQMQIYVFIMLLMSIVAVLRFNKVMMMVLMGVLVVTSFVYSIYMWDVDQGMNYYSTVSRFWEIGLGGLVGLAIVGRKIPVWLSWMLGIVGMGMILSVGVFLDGASVFPGPWTLIPLVGASFVVLAGQADKSVGVTWLLELPFFQWLGSIAYSLYLIHWPLLIVVKNYWEQWWSGVIVIAASLVLATLLHTVESMVIGAKGDRMSMWEYVKYVASTWRVSVPVVVIVAMVVAFPSLVREPVEPVVEEDYPGASSVLDGVVAPVGKPVWPLNDFEAMLPQTQSDGCFASWKDVDVVTTHDFNSSDEPCVYGDVDAEDFVYLAGGSHSEQYLPALDAIGKMRGFQVIPVLKMTCPMAPIPYDDGSPYPECAQWVPKAKEYMMDNPGMGVFMTSTRPEHPLGGGDEVIPDDYVTMIEDLSSVMPVWAVRDNPWMLTDSGAPLNPRECIAEGGDDCGMESRLEGENPAVAALGDDVIHIDLTRAFCPDGYCEPVIGNILVYRDNHHLTNAYVLSLVGELDREMFAEPLPEPKVAPEYFPDDIPEFSSHTPVSPLHPGVW